MSDTLNIKPRSLFSEILILIKHRLSLSVVFSSVASLNIKLKINKITITQVNGSSIVKIEFWNNEVRDGFVIDYMTEAPKNFNEVINKIKF